MANTLKENSITIVLYVIGLIVTMIIGYFTFVKENENEHVAARKTFESIDTKLSELDKYIAVNHKRISANEKELAILIGLPPRVTVLEESVNNINIAIAKQDTKLDYIQRDTQEIKNLIRELNKGQ